MEFKLTFEKGLCVSDVQLYRIINATARYVLVNVLPEIVVIKCFSISSTFHDCNVGIVALQRPSQLYDFVHLKCIIVQESIFKIWIFPLEWRRRVKFLLIFLPHDLEVMGTAVK